MTAVDCRYGPEQITSLRARGDGDRAIAQHMLWHMHISEP